MLVKKKTSIYFAIKFSLREISFVLYLRAPMTQMTLKSCAVGMCNSILRNHLNPASEIPGKFRNS